jgi:TonB family protein
VRVPRFSYELPPARKDRHVASLILHIVVIALALKVLPMLPGPQIMRPRTTVNVLFSPPVPQEPPAPTVKILPPPRKVLAALTPPKLVVPPPPEPKPAPPKIEMQPKLDLPNVAVIRPKLEQKVVTGTFTTPEAQKPVAKDKEVAVTTFSGSSQPATLNKPAKEVQTGGFGDPNGVRGTSDKKGPVQIAALGSFNMPAGPGNGNGTGGSRGASGTVAGSGFGDVAAGGNSDRTRRGGGTVSPAGFNQQSLAPVSVPKVQADDKSKSKPVEILFKPRPTYTAEARQLHVEGEVLVEVNFTASGQLQVQRVVRGLGHGLDESAQRAAQQIRFRPAQRNGAPYDSTALVHIVFALAE